MKRYAHFAIQALQTAALSLTALLAASCSMMETDLEDCSTGLYVNFRYDYNTQRADMFPDHVGGLSLYVFRAEDNSFVMRRDVANTASSAPLRDKNYSLFIRDTELPEGDYRLLAVAMQKDHDTALAEPGAKYRRTDLTAGVSTLADLRVTLDRGTTGTDGFAPVEHQGEPLDTLWMTRHADDAEANIGHMRAGCRDSVTLSLIRDTKQINLTLNQLDPAEDIADTDYDVTILDRNGQLLYNNELNATDTPLRYTPYAQWTTDLTDDTATTAAHRADNANVVKKQAHYELFCNRIVLDNAATLIVTHHNSGDTIAALNLPYYLVKGRAAYELYNYSGQEYLDREYQYNLDLFLLGGQWKYLDIRVGVLSWTRREQNENLH